MAFQFKRIPLMKLVHFGLFRKGERGILIYLTILHGPQNKNRRIMLLDTSPNLIKTNK